MTDLPKEYDVIIVGTGLAESILSAALSRIGKIVLHIDRNQFYGGEFSSHSLTSLIEWIDQLKVNQIQSLPNKCNNDLTQYLNENYYEWNPNLTEESKDKILKLSRRFSIDLTPNIFYSRGQFIELLISSDVSKYCEFRLVNQIITKNETKIEKVPTSRSEVFKTNQLSMIEKRVMMQFIQSCMKDNNFEDFFTNSANAEQITFREFIRNKKFSKSIENYLLNAVAMSSDENQSALDGLKQVKRFLNSVGRFGDSPFLFPLYGTGELPQCFCRMSAVFGAIYHLNLTLDSLNSNENLIESISTTNNSETYDFKCKHLVMDCTYAPLDFFDMNNEQIKRVSRCVLITNKSLFQSEDKHENISLLYLAKSSLNESGIYLLEASSASQCCPKDYYLIYMFCDRISQTSKEGFKNVINELFTFELDESKEGDSKDETTKEKNNKPSILFSYYCSYVDTNSLVENKNNKLPSNLFLCGGSRAELDFDHYVEQAKMIFEKICPNEQFLPRPPDQEDIIFGDEASNQETTTTSTTPTVEETSTETVNVEINNTKTET